MNIPKSLFDKLYPPVLKSDIEHFKMAIRIEEYFKDLEESYQHTNRYKTFLCDVKELARYSEYNPKFEENVTYGNDLFGPVGLIWTDDHAAPMTAETIKFNSKKERDQFIKKEKPLIYVMMEYDVMVDQNSIFDPNNAKKEKRWYVRYFKEVGKLSWFKYHIQFFSSKFKNNKIRAFLYRLLVVK